MEIMSEFISVSKNSSLGEKEAALEDLEDNEIINENVDQEPDNDKSDREIIDIVHEKVEPISDPVVFQRQPFRHLDQQLNENGLNLENKENFNSSFGLKVAVCVVDQKQDEIICLRNENAKLSSKIHLLEKNARIQNLRKEKEQLEFKHSCEKKDRILEKFKQDAQALSQEKQILAKELEEFKTKFYQTEKFAKKMTYQIDTSTITIQKLETELQGLHKDKRQHEEILSSLEKNYEKELVGLQEKIEKLDNLTKDHERKQTEKSDIIGDLLDRLDLEVTAKRKMADCISETSPQITSKISPQTSPQISPKISPQISPQISPKTFSSGSQKEEQYVLNMMANHEEIINLKTLLKETENEKLRMAKKCLKLKDENNRFCKQIENLSDGRIKTDQLGQKELSNGPTTNVSSRLRQYRLWSFQGRDTKLERFLAKNQL